MLTLQQIRPISDHIEVKLQGMPVSSATHVTLSGKPTITDVLLPNLAYMEALNLFVSITTVSKEFHLDHVVMYYPAALWDKEVKINELHVKVTEVEQTVRDCHDMQLKLGEKLAAKYRSGVVKL